MMMLFSKPRMTLLLFNNYFYFLNKTTETEANELRAFKVIQHNLTEAQESALTRTHSTLENFKVAKLVLSTRELGNNKANSPPTAWTSYQVSQLSGN
jgi:hypothetical protein